MTAPGRTQPLANRCRPSASPREQTLVEGANKCNSMANGAIFSPGKPHRSHDLGGLYGLLRTRAPEVHAPTVDVEHGARFGRRYARRWSGSSRFDCCSPGDRNNLRSPRRPAKVDLHRRPHPRRDSRNYVEGAPERQSRERYASGITGGGVPRRRAGWSHPRQECRWRSCGAAYTGARPALTSIISSVSPGWTRWSPAMVCAARYRRLISRRRIQRGSPRSLAT
jgi:hypothetical protein